MPLAWHFWTVVADAQPQGSGVPADGNLNVAAGMSRRAGHQMADDNAREGADLSQLPVPQDAGDELPGGAWRRLVRGQSQPLHNQDRGQKCRGYGCERRLGHDEVPGKWLGFQCLTDLRVRTGHRHRDTGPVPNVPPCRSQPLDRALLGTADDSG